MTSKEINQLITQIETHIECWKQFNHFIGVARTKKFSAADENNFLEIKSIIVQELELILASVEVQGPTRRCGIYQSRVTGRCATWRPTGTKFTSGGTPSWARSR
jgi:hypothetical protein